MATPCKRNCSVATPESSVKRPRVDLEVKASSRTVLQKLHIISRGASLHQLQVGPCQLPKNTSLLTPGRLVPTLGRSIDICWCTEKICRKAADALTLVHVSGSRRLCQRTTEEHEECILLREMMEKFTSEAQPSMLDCRLDHSKEAKKMSLQRISTAAFLLKARQVIGYISVMQSFEHEFTSEMLLPDLPEAALTQATNVRLELPLLMQIYVEEEYRRQGACSQALSTAFRGKSAVLVNSPSVPVAKVLHTLGFVCAAAKRVANQYDAKAPVYVQGLYVRAKE